MSTLTNGVVTVTPDLILGFESTNRAGTVVHRKLDGSIDVSLTRDAPREGAFKLFFKSESDAEAARQAFIVPATWAIDADIDTASMTFVRDGDMSAIQQDSRLRWILEVGYQEIV